MTAKPDFHRAAMPLSRRSRAGGLFSGAARVGAVLAGLGLVAGCGARPAEPEQAELLVIEDRVSTRQGPGGPPFGGRAFALPAAALYGLATASRAASRTLPPLRR